MVTGQLLAQLPGLPGCNPGQEQLNLNDCYRLGENQTVGDVYSSPAFLVNLIVRNLFVIGGIILLVMIVYAGFLFISKGTKGQEEAKNIVTSALAGFLLMFAAFWILQLIRIITGADILL